jgi:tetratricopeptide (TPR) repeat protein
MKRLLPVTSLLALLLCVSPASAQQPPGGNSRGATLATDARALASQGKLDAAIAMLDAQKALAGADGRRVRIVLGELLIRAGRRADAEPVLMTLVDDYNNDVVGSGDPEGLAMVARATHLLRHPKDANNTFKEAVRAGDKSVQTRLWWAELFAEFFDPGDAEAELKEAMSLDPKNADAMVMEARLKMDDAFDFAAAGKLLDQALAINPKHVGAFAVRAGMDLRDGDLDAANAEIDKGLAVNAGDLELLSLRAAARFLADDPAGYEAAKKQIFARNREFSRAYGIIGEYAEWEHRYDDVIGMMKDAVALDPKDGKAWAELGMWQTRAGQETDGVASLQEWWKHDHFNVRAFNTLEKLYTQWIPNSYESHTEEIFDVRYPKAERAILERYVPRMLGEAWGQMKVHYMFAPQVPVHVEMYESRDHFSVRTSGLPNIGIQGVCFGHVVAAMSPASEPFNWGNVLWHELGHVFAIQLSKNHVPRWFTEGLSEYETMVRRPEWQRELDPELYAALKAGKLPAAVDMNRAFTHADNGLDVTVAYYAASQMVAFTAEQFGWAKVTQALSLWGEGKRTPQVIEGAFGVTPAQYDAKFRSWAMGRLARYQGQYMFARTPVPLDEAKAAVGPTVGGSGPHVDLAFALLREHKVDEASKELDLALKADPNDKDAHFLSAKLAAAHKDAAGQEAHLTAIKTAGGDGYTVETALGQLALARKDKVAARAALESAHRFDPTQNDALHDLYEMADDEHRDADSLSLLREIARVDQHDRKAWSLLLSRLVKDKLWAEARKVGESALYVDVEDAGIHTHYAQALSALGDHDTASFELESALLCDAKPEQKAHVHALLARERQALGDMTGAKSHRDEALKLDPNNEDAKGMKL